MPGLISPYCGKKPKHPLLYKILTLSPCKKQRARANTNEAHISGNEFFLCIAVALSGKLLQIIIL